MPEDKLGHELGERVELASTQEDLAVSEAEGLLTNLQSNVEYGVFESAWESAKNATYYNGLTRDIRKISHESDAELQLGEEEAEKVYQPEDIKAKFPELTEVTGPRTGKQILGALTLKRNKEILESRLAADNKGAISKGLNFIAPMFVYAADWDTIAATAASALSSVFLGPGAVIGGVGTTLASLIGKTIRGATKVARLKNARRLNKVAKTMPRGLHVTKTGKILRGLDVGLGYGAANAVLEDYIADVYRKMGIKYSQQDQHISTALGFLLGPTLGVTASVFRKGIKPEKVPGLTKDEGLELAKLESADDVLPVIPPLKTSLEFHTRAKVLPDTDGLKFDIQLANAKTSVRLGNVLDNHFLAKHIGSEPINLAAYNKVLDYDNISRNIESVLEGRRFEKIARDKYFKDGVWDYKVLDEFVPEYRIHSDILVHPDVSGKDLNPPKLEPTRPEPLPDVSPQPPEIKRAPAKEGEEVKPFTAEEVATARERLMKRPVLSGQAIGKDTLDAIKEGGRARQDLFKGTPAKFKDLIKGKAEYEVMEILRNYASGVEKAAVNIKKTLLLNRKSKRLTKDRRKLYASMMGDIKDIMKVSEVRFNPRLKNKFGLYTRGAIGDTIDIKPTASPHAFINALIHEGTHATQKLFTRRQRIDDLIGDLLDIRGTVYSHDHFWRALEEATAEIVTNAVTKKYFGFRIDPSSKSRIDLYFSERRGNYEKFLDDPRVEEALNKYFDEATSVFDKIFAKRWNSPEIKKIFSKSDNQLEQSIQEAERIAVAAFRLHRPDTWLRRGRFTESGINKAVNEIASLDDQLSKFHELLAKFVTCRGG